MGPTERRASVSMRFEIPESELQWRFGPSGGPGGQHANKSATRADLTFDVEASKAFEDSMRVRLIEKLGSRVRISEDGSRSQATNRKRAARALHARLEDAARPDPPRRRRTRPSRAARQRRLDTKRERSATKQTRQTPSTDD